MRHFLPAVLGLSLLLASCAPALTGGFSVRNPTATGPRVGSAYGEIQRVTHSALFDIKLPGEPFVLMNSPLADLSVNEMLQGSSFRCADIEHLYWRKGDPKALSADVTAAIRQAGGTVTEGDRRSDGYRGVARLKGQVYMYDWWNDSESVGYSACRVVSR